MRSPTRRVAASPWNLTALWKICAASLGLTACCILALCSASKVWPSCMKPPSRTQMQLTFWLVENTRPSASPHALDAP